MKIIVTGANGFVGRELTKQLLEHKENELVLLDVDFSSSALSSAKLSRQGSVEWIEGQVQDSAVRKRMLANGCDILFHLAALPGGLSQSQPDLSKDINLDASLALFDEVAATGNCPRIVYASTIAVLGGILPEIVTDSSPVAPIMTYGCHKAMVELALADLSRRARVDGISVRLPGIVARPSGPSGLRSAFLSDVFHALNANKPFVCPVSGDASSWLMSIKKSAENLMHAAIVDEVLMPQSRVITLPALRVVMSDLIDIICLQTSTSPTLVTFQPDVDLERGFGKYPPLITTNADRAGFSHDGDANSLVASALSSIRN